LFLGDEFIIEGIALRILEEDSQSGALEIESPQRYYEVEADDEPGSTISNRFNNATIDKYLCIPMVNMVLYL